jgi:hypothetical protein
VVSRLAEVVILGFGGSYSRSALPFLWASSSVIGVCGGTDVDPGTERRTADR